MISLKAAMPAQPGLPPSEGRSAPATAASVPARRHAHGGWAIRWTRASAVAALLCAAVLSGAGWTALGADASPSALSQASSGEPACRPALEAGSQTVTIDVDDSDREVIIHVPASAEGLLPAVIAFHGWSAFAGQLEATSGLSDLADQSAFVVAYPQGLGSPTEWHFAGNLGYDQRDMAMIRELIVTLVTQACVDPERVFLAGHSMGGGMASDATCRMADQVAGVVLVAALWFELPCQPVRPVPVVALHAVDDPVLPYAGGPIGGVPSGIPEQLAVEAAVSTWAEHGGCGPAPVESDQPGGGALLAWPDCTAPVVLHRLPGGGHDWPSLASTLIAEIVAGA